jgi:hypothetical protein
MATALRVSVVDPLRDEYARAREYAAERLRARSDRPSRLASMSAEQRRGITCGDRPEVSGRWMERKRR